MGAGRPDTTVADRFDAVHASRSSTTNLPIRRRQGLAEVRDGGLVHRSRGVSCS
ncbi:hypothetical protein GFS60_07660 (plasmid) [Rhodococcus sp. WAY2]|nr:hypothetical protein GFS60_07660 [Rhodococcus sp. WAY2]